MTRVFYVHLDTKKSHYMKTILDELLGEANFRNEIIWKRQSAHNDSNQCGAIHDMILFYTRGARRVWNEILVKPSSDYIEEFFDQVEPGTNRRYARVILLPVDFLVAVTTTSSKASGAFGDSTNHHGEVFEGKTASLAERRGA